jgi:nucleotide-binding universal stress UspA family protein
MFAKILLSFDGSSHSVKAAEYAIRLAKVDNAEVEILHVRDTVSSYQSRTVFDTVSFEKSLVEEAEEILAKGVKKFEEAGLPVKSKILTGDPADVICNEAENNNYKLIIIGSRGLNPVSRFILGSVTSRILQHTDIPVLVVK